MSHSAWYPCSLSKVTLLSLHVVIACFIYKLCFQLCVFNPMLHSLYVCYGSIITSYSLTHLMLVQFNDWSVIKPRLLRPSTLWHDMLWTGVGRRRTSWGGFLYGLYWPGEWLWIDSNGKNGNQTSHRWITCIVNFRRSVTHHFLFWLHLVKIY